MKKQMEEVCQRCGKKKTWAASRQAPFGQHSKFGRICHQCFDKIDQEAAGK